MSTASTTRPPVAAARPTPSPTTSATRTPREAISSDRRPALEQTHENVAAEAIRSEPETDLAFGRDLSRGQFGHSVASADDEGLALTADIRCDQGSSIDEIEDRDQRARGQQGRMDRIAVAGVRQQNRPEPTAGDKDDDGGEPDGQRSHRGLRALGSTAAYSTSERRLPRITATAPTRVAPRISGISRARAAL